ncbi:hypothetical protein [Amycolatopsis sp. WQ 127309]|uniref:hypothetical protein n=1 Tax=Amycolatopsis sp. WQ 127309 TaxID=2932773 RepID=UPI001FF3CF2A|nr:hypothetical protein [Amycolatopsis sp. WQ 127309]UOZ07011.1 hypothetical protein MUY22_01570 [Amycolatopsis sp. WQ 127309]
MPSRGTFHPPERHCGWSRSEAAGSSAERNPDGPIAEWTGLDPDSLLAEDRQSLIDLLTTHADEDVRRAERNLRNPDIREHVYDTSRSSQVFSGRSADHVRVPTSR